MQPHCLPNPRTHFKIPLSVVAEGQPFFFGFPPGGSCRASARRMRGTAARSGGAPLIRHLLRKCHLPPSSSQALYPSSRRKRQASLTPLLVLSPRSRKFRIPRPAASGRPHSLHCSGSPHERHSAFRGAPIFAALGSCGGPERPATFPPGGRLNKNVPHRLPPLGEAVARKRD